VTYNANELTASNLSFEATGVYYGTKDHGHLA